MANISELELPVVQFPRVDTPSAQISPPEFSQLKFQ
jgi:hypothetical protein